MSAPAIRVEDLSVSYHGVTVLDSVGFAVESGTLVGIVGPNGAGKSTLLQALLGLIPRDRGRVTFFGHDLRQYRKRIAYLPQRSLIDWDFPVTVLDTVLLGTYPSLGWFRRPGEPEREWAYACLEKVGMVDYADRQIGELSGGQQQRMFVARALAQDPEILFLDEPFTGIDAQSESTILSILGELRDEGRTALIVHHSIDKVRAHFDDVLLLNRVVVDHGPPERVLRADAVARLFMTPPPDHLGTAV